MSLQSPYWGDQPIKVARRNSVRRSTEIVKDEGPLNQKRASGSQRMSASTMDSSSQIISPTGSYFPDALQPRPPSFHQEEQPKKRRQREGREKSSQHQPPPQAPDVPRQPPPLSYKSPYPKEKTASQIPVRSRSTRRMEEPIEAPIESEVMGRTSRKKVDVQDVGKGNTIPRRSQKQLVLDSLVAQNDGVNDKRERHTRSTSSTAAEATLKKREWASDRSPLQRLELALGSLTKGEKRARAEEAELLARRIPPRTTSTADRRVQEPPKPIQFAQRAQRELHITREEGSRDASNKQNSDLQPPKLRIQEVPGRGNSFRERAALALGSGAAAAAIGIGNGSLGRSSSKKLKKEPPGDPWYSRRNEAESKSRDIKQKGRQSSRESDDSYDSTDDDLPVRKGSSRKIEQLTGNTTTITENERSRQINGINFAPKRKGNPPGNPEDTRGPQHHHHISALIPGHHNRDSYTPGNGLYLPPKPLREWRQGVTGFLSAAYTNLDAKQTEVEKNKAWWEAEESGKIRSRPPRTRLGHKCDELNEDSNGTVFPNLSLERDGAVGGEGSANAVKVRRGNSVGKSPSELQPKSGRTPQSIKSPGIISPYSSKCLHPSEHNILYPFHICPSKANKLTECRVRPVTVPTVFKPALYLKCGPLLRYTGIRREPDVSLAAPKKGIKGREIWRGSVLIVTTDEHSDYVTPPILRLFNQPMDMAPPPPTQFDGTTGNLASEYVDPILGMPKIARDGQTLYVRPVEDLDFGVDLSRDETDTGLFEKQRSTNMQKGGFDGSKDPKANRGLGKRDGEKVGKYLEVPAVKLDVEQGVTFWRFNIEVELAQHPMRIAYRINHGPATGFWVPARGEAMNIMFYSCNGFTPNVDTATWSGPDPLWRDVLNSHQTRPFHCMIGGGDQLYNDLVVTETELFQDWIDLKNPMAKHDAPLTPEMQLELETFYLNRYCMWFSQGLFGLATSQIPMINIFDDHDIIDGFGSYPDYFMGSPVFKGLGAIAYRFYLLFQHHTIIEEGEEEPSWIIGPDPGPWMGEHSRSVYLSLGKSIAFLGLDCRTERKRSEIVSRETYDKVFDRCRREIRSGETKHLILLLGIPIAYPRLVWLETLLTSRLLDPIRYAGRIGLFKGLINEFDGGVEILDDLDDHWCAKSHKAERNWFVEELQKLAAETSVRITLLGGDVHLGAIGRFYSNPNLRVPKDRDFRYMPNIISSAIANEPPPDSMADMMNKRNKIHHLNRDTDESMVPIFTHDVDNKPRNNKCLLPRRNWCSINVYVPGNSPPPTPPPIFDGSDRQTPSPQLQGGSIRNHEPRGPSYTPDATSRPPLSGNILRKLSSRGRTSSDSARPSVLSRTLSLTRRPFFSRNSSKRGPDDGGINGYGAESDESLPNESQTSIANSSHFSFRRRGKHETTRSDGNINSSYVHQRGGAGGYDERPAFRRAPTDLAHNLQESINLEGGLEITLNAEREKGDPSGITVPYQFIVPALWYDIERDGRRVRRPSALERLKSFGKGRGAQLDR